MAVRSARIVGPQSIAAGTSDGVYTVPSGRLVIVKFVVARASASGTVGVIYVGSAASANLMWNAAIPAALAVKEPVWLVFHENEVIRLQADGSSAVVFSLHGAVLVL